MYQIIGISIFSAYFISLIFNYFFIRKMIDEDIQTNNRCLDIRDVIFALAFITIPIFNTFMMAIFLIETKIFSVIEEFIILLFKKIMFLGGEK